MKSKKKKKHLFKKLKLCVTIYNAIKMFGVSTFFLSVFKKLILSFRRDVLNE